MSRIHPCSMKPAPAQLVDGAKWEQHRRGVRADAVPKLRLHKRVAKLVGPFLHRVDKAAQMLLCRPFQLGSGIALVL
jgi:hypothetical protein